MRRAIDLSFYLVTNRRGLNSDDFLHVVREAVRGGVTIVQLREKDCSTNEMIDIGEKLQELLKPLHIPLIINDRADVAYALKADGVHLGQTDINIQEARKILGNEAIIGLSVETLEQALESNDADVDYIAASPLFSTKTKLDCNQPLGLSGLKKMCAISSHPVIAIGGIDESNVESVFACGATGAAVVSAIFNAPCPKTSALAIAKRIKQHARVE